MVDGSDRIGEFDRVLQKYNGKDYNFNSIKTVSSAIEIQMLKVEECLDLSYVVLL